MHFTSTIATTTNKQHTVRSTHVLFHNWRHTSIIKKTTRKTSTTVFRDWNSILKLNSLFGGDVVQEIEVLLAYWVNSWMNVYQGTIGGALVIIKRNVVNFHSFRHFFKPWPNSYDLFQCSFLNYLLGSRLFSRRSGNSLLYMSTTAVCVTF